MAKPREKGKWKWAGIGRSKPVLEKKRGWVNLTLVFLDEDHFLACKYLLARFKGCPLLTLVRTEESAATLSERHGERFAAFNYAMLMVQNHVVICTHQATRPMMMQMIMPVWRSGRNNYAISQFKGPSGRPQFFDENKDRILKVVNHLSDEASVMCYVGRLKAIILGNAGYQPMSSYWQYWHPLVQVRWNDVVCDAGVGTSPHGTLGFAKSSGPEGHVFGFEPIKRMYEQLAAQTAEADTVEMVPMGLWSVPGLIEMVDDGDTSTFREMDSSKDKPKELCQLTSIDSFFGERGLVPNMIKMDIEGAESEALAGAKSTIENHAPRLQICLYHSLEDFITIPLQILEYRPDYKLYVGHHTPFFNECVLYARAD